jgi:hypothetical protein
MMRIVERVWGSKAVVQGILVHTPSRAELYFKPCLKKLDVETPRSRVGPKN